MNGSKSAMMVSSLVLAIGAVFAAGDAQAATSPRVDIRNPADICQSALPVFDGQIRKRPKAVQNEGTSTAFVTCAFPSQGGYGASASNPSSVEIFFAVNDGVADSITCTGVSGYNTQSGAPANSIKTAVLPASGAQVSLTWLPVDFGGSTTMPNGLFSVSCQVNPGVGINNSGLIFAEEIGA